MSECEKFKEIWGREMEDMKFKGELLREERKFHRMSLEKLGELTNTSKAHVWEIEKGRTQPSGFKVFLFAKALNVNMEYFYGETKEQKDYASYVGTQVINLMKKSSKIHTETICVTLDELNDMKKLVKTEGLDTYMGGYNEAIDDLMRKIYD